MRAPKEGSLEQFNRPYDLHGELRACADQLRQGAIADFDGLQQVWGVANQVHYLGIDDAFVDPAGNPLRTLDAELVWRKRSLDAWTLADHERRGLAGAVHWFTDIQSELDAPLETLEHIPAWRNWLGHTLGIANPYGLPLDELAKIADSRIALSDEILRGRGAELPRVEQRQGVLHGFVEDRAEVGGQQQKSAAIPGPRQSLEGGLRPGLPEQKRRDDNEAVSPYTGNIATHKRAREWPHRLRQATLLAGAAVLAALIPASTGSYTPQHAETTLVVPHDANTVASGGALTELPDALQPKTAPERATPITEAFLDSLQPRGYHGEAYEWGAIANKLAPSHATAELQTMVQNARKQGAHVQIWHDERSRRWGISYVAVKLDNGKYAVYSDTAHKLAILQWYTTQ